MLMLIGRLEMYTVFLIFLPSFWNPNRVRTG
jgi:Trk-type K+ transport system membrane component